MICSRKNCDKKGEFVYCRQKNSIWMYCRKHYRFCGMIDGSKQRYKQKLSLGYLEDLYIKLFGDTLYPDCPTCKRKMIWHTSFGKRCDLITIQHWTINNISFLCHRCNTMHGNSTCKNILNLKIDESWCSKCKSILHKNLFHKGATYCKLCVKQISEENRKTKKQKRFIHCFYCNKKLIGVKSNRKFCNQSCGRKYKKCMIK